jgi:hypothetical protein
MNIIDAYIDWDDKEANGRLVLVMDGVLPDDKDLWSYSSKFFPEYAATIYYGCRQDGLVRFYWDGKHSKVIPYSTDLTSDSKEVHLEDPSASACSTINWLDFNKVHCIDAKFVNQDKDEVELNYYTHITIDKCIDIMKQFIPNIKLVKHADGDLEEIAYLLEKTDEKDTNTDKVIYSSVQKEIREDNDIPISPEDLEDYKEEFGD